MGGRLRVVRLPGGVFIGGKVENAWGAAMGEGEGDRGGHVIAMDEVDGCLPSGAKLSSHPLHGMPLWADEASQTEDGGVGVRDQGAFGGEKPLGTRRTGERGFFLCDLRVVYRLGVYACAARVNDVRHPICRLRQAFVGLADGVS